MRHRISTLIVLACTVLLSACSSIPVIQYETRSLTVEQLLGRWYIHAHVPYFAERGKLAPQVEYRLRDDGKVDDLYSFKKSADGPREQWEGVAWVLNPGTNTRWKARFIWPLSTEFHFVAVADDYRWAALGTPDRKLAWIYGRDATIAPDDYAAATAALASNGFDSSALVSLPH